MTTHSITQCKQWLLLATIPHFPLSHWSMSLRKESFLIAARTQKCKLVPMSSSTRTEKKVSSSTSAYSSPCCIYQLHPVSAMTCISTLSFPYFHCIWPINEPFHLLLLHVLYCIYIYNIKWIVYRVQLLSNCRTMIAMKTEKWIRQKGGLICQYSSD